MSAIAPARATRAELRGAFHGHILEAISEQVWLYDPHARRRIRYAKLAWKILLARQFLTPQFDDEGELIDPPSTERASDDEFRTFLHQVCAWAATEWKVSFPVKEPS